MKLLKVKNISALFWQKEEQLKVVPMRAEAGIPWIHWLIDLLHKQLSVLMLEQMHHCGLDVSAHLNLWPCIPFLRKPITLSHTLKHPDSTEDGPAPYRALYIAVETIL
jgi:hypothetical protein